MDLREYIRDVPDFPSPGILFRDITPLLQSPEAFDHVIDRFSNAYSDRGVDAVCGIEARGFLFAAPLALRLGKPMVPVRKGGQAALPDCQRHLLAGVRRGRGRDARRRRE